MPRIVNPAVHSPVMDSLTKVGCILISVRILCYGTVIPRVKLDFRADSLKYFPPGRVELMACISFSFSSIFSSKNDDFKHFNLVTLKACIFFIFSLSFESCINTHNTVDVRWIRVRSFFDEVIILLITSFIIFNYYCTLESRTFKHAPPIYFLLFCFLYLSFVDLVDFYTYR